MDYAALAAKHGGKTEAGPDYAALAAKFGATPQPSRMDLFKAEAMTSLPGGMVRGIKDLVDTGAEYASKIGGDSARIKAENDAGKADFEAAQKLVGAGGSDVTRVGGQVAGTAPFGGAIATGLGAIPRVAQAVPNLLQAIRTSGMTGGNHLTRAAGAAATGTAAGFAADPNSAVTSGAVSAALPGTLKVAGGVGQWAGGKAGDATDWAARKLMQSALKPTIQQLKSGEAAIAVRTLLDNGINATEGGVNKLKELIDGLNTQISDKIAGSTATIDKQKVIGALGDTRQRFGNQVSPTDDLAAIGNVEKDFLNHPNLPGATIPVQDAQRLKQGTYKVLKGKYGQMGSAETEAQKSLARGLKDEIAEAVPGVGAWNAEESRLLTTLAVAERRALMDMNKNPVGLSALAGNPISFAAFMADRSAAFKSLAARMVNTAAKARNPLEGMTTSSLPYRSAPVLAADR